MTLFPTPENVSGFVGLMQYGQVVAEGWLGPGISIMSLLVLYTSLKQFDNSRALLSATFINVILAALLFFLQLLPQAWLYGWIIVFALILAYHQFFEA